VYRQEEAENKQAVDRPFGSDDEAEQQGDDTACDDPAPACRWFGFEAEPDAECAGTEKCGCQKKGQYTGCQHRIDEGDDACRRIEQPAQNPEKETAPGFNAECVYDFHDAAN